MTTPRYPLTACVAGSQVHADATPWSQDHAFYVNLNNGNVNNNHRNNSGFGLPARRAREFQGAEGVKFRTLYDAYQSARRGKKPSYDKLAFDTRYIDGLLELQAELNAGTWSPGPTTCFVATRPKAREIHAPPFRDRVVHHLTVPPLEVKYELRFYAHSYANRVCKGSHAAVRYAQACVRQIHSGQGGGFYLQLDIANFFISIRRDILWADMKPVLLHAHLPAGIVAVTHALLRGDPLRAGVRMRATHAQLALVPPHKRLCNARAHCGLPVGNLSSQFLANVYLDPLDQFVKHVLKAKRYLRYVDDFVLFHQDRTQLVEWQRRIEEFLAERLDLRLKDDVKLRPLTDGLDFLGYVIFPTHTLVRKRVVSHAREAFAAWEQQHVTGNAIRATPAQLRALQATAASYAGHLKHANSQRLQAALHRRFPWLSTAAHPRRVSAHREGMAITLRFEAHTNG